MEQLSVLYHVTPIKNHNSISRTGVDPVFSRGKQKLSWWVSLDKLMWAVAHCSARYGVSANDLEIWFAPTAKLRKSRRTAWQGVFCTPCNTRPDGFLSTQEMIERLK